MMRFPAKKKTHPKVHLTALIDIIFLLLIFFLLASSFDEQDSIVVIVPEVSNKNPALTPDLIIKIDHQGNLYFDGILVNEQQLTSVIKVRLTQSLKDTVIIQADHRVAYDKVVQAIDAAKTAGAKNLLLVTKQKIPQ